MKQDKIDISDIKREEKDIEHEKKKMLYENQRN